MANRTESGAGVLPEPVALGLAPSFGFGDRLGLATPGHVAALKTAGGGFLPVFAQQSIREMVRTNRTPRDVMDDAMRGSLMAGYAGPQGADADHLKTIADVEATAAAGFIFFTIDPSDYVDQLADDYDENSLVARYRAVAKDVAWAEAYIGQRVPLSDGRSAVISPLECHRAAVKYGYAVNHVIAMSRRVEQLADESGRAFEIELSVDETAQPTSPAEHFIFASECLRSGVKLVSLAPRFVGDFEKGVDYKGDIAEFERHAADHAAIAAELGPYKLSLHSGSDKLSIYPILSRVTGGKIHVKTAGTSYLEALRVVALHDVGLFREIVEFSRARYDLDKASYHVSARLADAPPAAELASDIDVQEAYLGLWSRQAPMTGMSNPGRQIVHCTFGSVLTDARLAGALRDVLEKHADTYAEVLEDHFARHLSALNAGLPA